MRKELLYGGGRMCCTEIFTSFQNGSIVLCCFHGLQVESSFNVMNAIIDCGIEPWSGQSKDYNVGIFCYIVY